MNKYAIDVLHHQIDEARSLEIFIFKVIKQFD